MVDRLPDPSLPFADRDRARLRSDFDHTALERLLARLPPGERGVLFELACAEPDYDAVFFALAEGTADFDDEASPHASASRVVLPPQLEDFSFDDPATQALLEATVAPARRGAILHLWQQHELAAFPPGCRGADVDGVHLVLVDADVAGCVLTFLESGTLDAQRHEILQRCAADIERILPQLDQQATVHFQRLGALAALVLERLNFERSAA
jgi:hypothetical protein